MTKDLDLEQAIIALQSGQYPVHFRSNIAVVIELYSRKPTSISQNSQLTSKAPKMAYVSRSKPSSVLFQSDQGIHYTGRHYRQILCRYQIKKVYLVKEIAEMIVR